MTQVATKITRRIYHTAPVTRAPICTLKKIASNPININDGGSIRAFVLRGYYIASDEYSSVSFRPKNESSQNSEMKYRHARARVSSARRVFRSRIINARADLSNGEQLTRLYMVLPIVSIDRLTRERKINRHDVRPLARNRGRVYEIARFFPSFSFLLLIAIIRAHSPSVYLTGVISHASRYHAHVCRTLRATSYRKEDGDAFFQRRATLRAPVSDERAYYSFVRLQL